MTLSHTLLFSVSLAALGGISQAQTLPSNATVGVGTYTVDGSSATVGQTITLGIPKRFGLHLHRNTWKLDLTNLKSDGTVDSDGGDANCWRAGDHSSGLNGTGRDVLYDIRTGGTIPVNAAQSVRDGAFIDFAALIWQSGWRGDQATDPSNPYSYTGSLGWGDDRIQRNIGGYPGFYVNGGKLEWKGPIQCSFQSVVQTFSNSTVGWQLTAQVADNTAASQTFPFALYTGYTFTDEQNGNYGAYFTNPASIWHNPRPGGVALRSSDLAAKRLARGTNITTGGWFDGNLLEILVFDGTVAAGTYSGIVTLALADYIPPADLNGL